MATQQELFGGGTAVITGAGAGIGEGLAHHAAGLGMRLVLADIAEERLDKVAAAITAERPGATVVTVPTDVSDYAAVDRLAERATSELGPVRLLVNNAGIETTGPLWELPPERWDQMMKVNVYGVFHGIRAFVPRMLAAGARADVVNLSSVGGLSVGPLQGAYIAGKFAVQALTECLFMELEATGAPIAVSVVNPGPVATRIFEDAEAAEGGGADTDAYRTTMRTMLRDQGLTPAQAAATIFEGVADGRFWIFPQPDMAEDAIRRRTDMLVHRSAPKARRAD